MSDFPPPPPSASNFPPPPPSGDLPLPPPPPDNVSPPPPPDLPVPDLPAIPEPPRRQLPKIKIQRKHVLIALGVIVLGCAIGFGFPAYQRWQDERAWKAACAGTQSAGEDYEKAAATFRTYTIAHPHGRHLEEAENKIQVGLEEGDWKRTRDQIASAENSDQIISACEAFRSNYSSGKHNLEMKKLIDDRLNQLAKQDWEDTQKKASEVEASGNLSEAFRLVDDYINRQKSMTRKSEARAFKQELGNRRYEALLEDGKQKEAKKDWESALAVYRIAGELKPKESVPHDGIARVQSAVRRERFDATMKEGKAAEAKGERTAALSAYKNALQIIPDSPEAKQAIAPLEAADRQERFDAAMKAATEAEVKDDRIVALAGYKNAGQLNPDVLEPKQAIARLEAAERRERFDAAMKEAKEAEAKGDRAGALVDYKKAIQINPDSPEARQAVARLEEVAKLMMEGVRAEARKDWENALVAYQNALQRIPNVGDAREAVERVKENLIMKLESQAETAIANKKWESARTYYRHIRELNTVKGDEGLQRIDAAESAAKRQKTLDDAANVLKNGLRFIPGL